MNKEEIDYISEYYDFWEDIVENEDGSLNKDQIMRELSDYSMVLDNCAKAYYTMTDGMISKQNTNFFEVENIFNQNYTRTEYYDELEEENKQLKDNWNNLKEFLNNEIKSNEESDKKYNCEWQGYRFFNKILEKMQELEKSNGNE